MSCSCRKCKNPCTSCECPPNIPTVECADPNPCIEIISGDCITITDTFVTNLLTYLLETNNTTIINQLNDLICSQRCCQPPFDLQVELIDNEGDNIGFTLTWTPGYTYTSTSQNIYYRVVGTGGWILLDSVSPSTFTYSTAEEYSRTKMYEFYIENQCGTSNTAISPTVTAVYPICLTLGDTTVTTTTIGQSWLWPDSWYPDIVSYTTELVEIPTSGIEHISGFIAPPFYQTISFTGLTPGTTYTLRIVTTFSNMSTIQCDFSITTNI